MRRPSRETMPVRSAALIDLLPDLRRYALALTGERARADDLVEQCLEQVLANQAALNDAQVRLVTFALFDRLYEAERLNREEPEIGAGPAADLRDGGFHDALRRLPVEERKALLLSRMARFSRTQVAAILRTSAPVAAARAWAARDRLRRALARRVLVIETEPVMALSLAQVVRRMGHRLSGIAPTRVQALARLPDAPDLVLAGVHRHGEAVAIVREVLRARPVPVVFVVDRADEPIAAPPSASLVVAQPIAPGVLEAAVRRLLGAADRPATRSRS